MNQIWSNLVTKLNLNFILPPQTMNVIYIKLNISNLSYLNFSPKHYNIPRDKIDLNFLILICILYMIII